MRDAVEVIGQISIYHLAIALTEQLVDFLDGIARATLGSLAIGIGFKISLEDRLDHKLDGCPHHPVPDRRDAE